jgi:hypothetical protein
VRDAVDGVEDAPVERAGEARAAGRRYLHNPINVLVSGSPSPPGVAESSWQEDR